MRGAVRIGSGWIVGLEQFDVSDHKGRVEQVALRSRVPGLRLVRKSRVVLAWWVRCGLVVTQSWQ